MFSVFKSFNINNKLKSAKNVHIMFNDFFNKPFVDFLNKNFDTKEHLVLCKRIFSNLPFPQGENVLEYKSLNFLNFDKCEKIFCHSLFDGKLINFLCKHKNLLQKTYWIMWGGDLYNASRNEKNDYVKRNVKGYIALIQGDELIAGQKYGEKPNWYAPYSTPISGKMLSSVKQTKKNNSLVIQINNSADESTVEMLSTLSKYKDENIKIVTILSYGNLKFKEQIIEKGKDIFGDKFTYIDEYMKPLEYAEHLAKIDVLVLNQNRQQGVGNCTACAYLGKKIFIKSNVTSFSYLQNLGIKVFDTHKIKEMNFDEFKSFDNIICEQNIKNIEFYYDENYQLNAWKKIF